MTAEFDEALQAVLTSSKGGIPSGTKIKEVASYCVNNVQYESVFIQKLYLQFRKAPATHKIGLLYIADLILRDFLQFARKSGQDQWVSAPDGTHMAGFNRMKEILPQFLNDVLVNISDDHKEKVRKLIDIWERGGILSAEYLAPYKRKLATPSSSPSEQFSIEGVNFLDLRAADARTPSISPPPGFDPLRPNVPKPKMADPSQNAQSTASILNALAQMAKQKPASGSPAPQATQPLPVPAAVAPAPIPVSAPPLGYPYTAPQTSMQPQPPVSPPVNPQQQPTNLSANFGALLGLGQQQPTTPSYLQQPQQPAAPMVDPTVQAQQMALLQLLMQQPQLAQAAMPQLATLFAGMGGMGALGAMGMPTQGQTMPHAWQQHQQPGRSDRDSRDRMYSPPPRSPPRRDHRGRSRSRSPLGGRRSDSPPFRRRSPVYGEYDGGRRDSETSESRGRGGSRGGRGRYGTRKPSPHRRGGRERSKSPGPGQHTRPRKKHYSEEPPHVERLVEPDPTVGPDKIKVYSRTLFVGGVTGIKEDDLRDMFARYGYVQSCILNNEKRHAFIKMYTREDAIAAKEGMASYKWGDITIRTRWGVGFGPRECTNYESGISVIPLDRLTEADKRWVVSANYGGTGGLPLRGGIAIEEPDIEIGAGVSSKAISKRHDPLHRGGDNKRKYSDWDAKSSTDKGSRKKDYGDYDSSRRDGDGHAPPPPTPGFGGGNSFPLYSANQDPYQTAANLSNYFYGNQNNSSGSS